MYHGFLHSGDCMNLRLLGRTGIRVSPVTFGAGPVSGLMTQADDDRQLSVVRRAIERGINWFDTAATYGAGRSETALGKALQTLRVADQIHIATKVRFMPEHLEDVRGHVTASMQESLARLRVDRVTLLQLHNSITANRGDEPTSMTPEDVLGPCGVLSAFEELRARGVVQYLGLTGIGQPEALREVIDSGAFDTIQTPYNLLNPSSGRVMPPGFAETNYGDLVANCERQAMGVFAIRVYAGGALAGNAPSDHTLQTKFFPLELYQRDTQRADRLCEALGCHRDELIGLGVRYALSHPDITAAIVGMGEPEHVDGAIKSIELGPLAPETIELIHRELNFNEQASPGTAP